MTRVRIMVVDDDPSTCQSLEKVFRAEGFESRAFCDGEAAKAELDGGLYDVLVTDVVMEPVTGLDLLTHVKEQNLDTVVILLTGYGDIPSAVDAVKRGAFDYLAKPVDVDRLCLQVAQAGRQSKLKRENRELRELMGQRNPNAMIGDATSVRELKSAIERAASSDVTVLITGESGAGKELVARNLYELGPRANAPFVVVNCAAIPATLVESEFFGHERGAFTGAVKRRIGRFEQAHDGTLFLDEIGDIEPQVQVKLLRVLQERSFERVGGDQTIEVDTRVISATRYDLEQRVAEGLFREDLYYRLSVVHLRVPPLRERREDIPLLLDYFVATLAARHGRPAPKLDAQATAALSAYDWPGNVRELCNCVEGLVVMGREKVIRVNDLPLQVRGGHAGNGEIRTLAEIEREAILSTLAQVGGNRAEAARLLGIGTKTLYRRLHEYGVLGPEDGSK